MSKAELRAPGPGGAAARPCTNALGQYTALTSEVFEEIFGPDWDKLRSAKTRARVDFSGDKFNLEALEGPPEGGLLHPSLHREFIEVLNVARNRLTDISCLNHKRDAHFEFKKLKVLNASHNALMEVRLELPSLLELNLSHNELQQVPSLACLQELQKLVLSHNCIDGSLEQLELNRRLRVLDISSNRFSWRPSRFKRQLDALQQCHIEHLRVWPNPFAEHFTEYQFLTVTELDSLTHLDGFLIDREMRKELRKQADSWRARVDYTVFDIKVEDRVRGGTAAAQGSGGNPVEVGQVLPRHPQRSPDTTDYMSEVLAALAEHEGNEQGWADSSMLATAEVALKLIRAPGAAGQQAAAAFTERGLHARCWARARRCLVDGAIPMPVGLLSEQGAEFTALISVLLSVVCAMLQVSGEYTGNSIMTDLTAAGLDVFHLMLEVAAYTGVPDPLILVSALEVIHTFLNHRHMRPRVLGAVIDKLHDLAILLPYLRGPFMNDQPNVKYQELWRQCETKYGSDTALREQLPELWDTGYAGLGDRSRWQSHVPEVCNLRNPLMHRALLGVVRLVRLFSEKAETDAGLRRVTCLLDRAGREELLIGPTKGLITCPDYEVKVECLLCISHVLRTAPEQFELVEMGWLMLCLTPDGVGEGGRQEEFLAQLVDLVTLLARSKAGVGTMFRQNFAKNAIRECFEMLRSSTRCNLHGDTAQEASRSELAIKIVRFLEVCSRASTAGLRKFLRRADLLRCLQEVVEAEDERGGVGCSGALLQTWTGRHVAGVLLPIVCGDGLRIGSPSRCLALLRLADVLQGRSDPDAEEPIAPSGERGGWPSAAALWRAARCCDSEELEDWREQQRHFVARDGLKALVDFVFRYLEEQDCPSALEPAQDKVRGWIEIAHQRVNDLWGQRAARKPTQPATEKRHTSGGAVQGSRAQRLAEAHMRAAVPLQDGGGSCSSTVSCAPPLFRAAARKQAEGGSKARNWEAAEDVACAEGQLPVLVAALLRCAFALIEAPCSRRAQAYALDRLLGGRQQGSLVPRLLELCLCVHLDGRPQDEEYDITSCRLAAKVLRLLATSASKSPALFPGDLAPEAQVKMEQSRVWLLHLLSQYMREMLVPALLRRLSTVVHRDLTVGEVALLRELASASAALASAALGQDLRSTLPPCRQAALDGGELAHQPRINGHVRCVGGAECFPPWEQAGEGALGDDARGDLVAGLVPRTLVRLLVQAMLYGVHQEATAFAGSARHSRVPVRLLSSLVNRSMGALAAVMHGYGLRGEEEACDYDVCEAVAQAMASAAQLVPRARITQLMQERALEKLRAQAQARLHRMAIADEHPSSHNAGGGGDCRCLSERILTVARAWFGRIGDQAAPGDLQWCAVAVTSRLQLLVLRLQEESLAATSRGTGNDLEVLGLRPLAKLQRVAASHRMPQFLFLFWAGDGSCALQSEVIIFETAARRKAFLQMLQLAEEDVGAAEDPSTFPPLCRGIPILPMRQEVLDSVQSASRKDRGTSVSIVSVTAVRSQEHPSAGNWFGGAGAGASPQAEVLVLTTGTVALFSLRSFLAQCVRPDDAEHYASGNVEVLPEESDSEDDELPAASTRSGPLTRVPPAGGVALEALGGSPWRLSGLQGVWFLAEGESKVRLQFDTVAEIHFTSDGERQRWRRHLASVLRAHDKPVVSADQGASNEMAWAVVPSDKTSLHEVRHHAEKARQRGVELPELHLALSNG